MLNSVGQRARSFFSLCPTSSRTCKLPRARCLSPCSTIRRGYANVANTAGKPVTKQKPYYVTSPIFYVNAAPHAGHLYTLLLTDILKRWQLLKGNQNATLLTGTDEHGMKIQKAAEKAKTDTKAFCDQHARQFQSLAERANVKYDRFIRTTDEDHKAAVEHFWRELNHRGYIYESKHEGWYSVSDETFYPESQVHLILDPSTGRKLQASIETGKEVEWTSETNYHFRLSVFKDKLLQHYHDHPEFIVPRTRMNFIVKEVESGLSDLSISRPSSRLTWGIPVPGDDSQTIYVWLDALINYITMAGYPFASKEAAEALWPPDCQVIGKDIVRFHCIYWPAFLMALDLPVTKQFLTHAHWTMNREKMSKSVGNVVNPFYAMDRFGVDVIRYYMAHDGGIVDDADYDNGYIVDRYKKGLHGGLGNLVSRVVRGKKWNVRESVELMSNKGEKNSNEMLETSRKHTTHLKRVPAQVQKSMDELNPRQALHIIMDLVYSTNKYFQESAPWDMAAFPDDKVQKELKRIIYLTAESIRIVAILLQPFMPEKAAQALDLLGVDPAWRRFMYTAYGADIKYGSPRIDVGKAGSAGTLFPPLASEF